MWEPLAPVDSSLKEFTHAVRKKSRQGKAIISWFNVGNKTDRVTVFRRTGGHRDQGVAGQDPAKSNGRMMRKSTLDGRQ